MKITFDLDERLVLKRIYHNCCPESEMKVLKEALRKYLCKRWWEPLGIVDCPSEKEKAPRGNEEPSPKNNRKRSLHLPSPVLKFKQQFKNVRRAFERVLERTKSEAFAAKGSANSYAKRLICWLYRWNILSFAVTDRLYKILSLKDS